MSFIATGSGTEDSEDPDVPATQIANEAFFPAIDLADLQAAMRLDGTVTPERLRAATVEAMASVNQDLATWRATQEATGFAALEAVPAPRIDDASVHVTRYVRAVYCLAKANLTERYRDFDTTHDGRTRATELESPIDDLRRDARWAVRDILGQRRTTVELI